MPEKETYECPECELHYYDKEIVKKCEAFCTEFKSCNIELIKHSVESQKQREQAQKVL